MSEYRIVLPLSESEFLALVRLGYKDMRPPRIQALYLLRLKLKEEGELIAQETISLPKGAIS